MNKTMSYHFVLALETLAALGPMAAQERAKIRSVLVVDICVTLKLVSASFLAHLSENLMLRLPIQ